MMSVHRLCFCKLNSQVDSGELGTVHECHSFNPALVKLPAQPKCFASFLFILVLYLFDALSFVLFNTTRKEYSVCIVIIAKTFSMLIGGFAILL